jgi:hypothetical protein
VRCRVLRNLVKESLIISGITLIFLLICATVGISTSTPPTTPAAEAAYETEGESEDLRLDRDTSRKFKNLAVLPLDD